MAELTAQAVFAEAFQSGRAPRSEAYKQGVLDCLRVRIDGAQEIACPFTKGTAEADAYLSGVDEGEALSHSPDEVGLRDVYAYLDEVKSIDLTQDGPTRKDAIMKLWLAKNGRAVGGLFGLVSAAAFALDQKIPGALLAGSALLVAVMGSQVAKKS